jgi:carboxypeptidase-like protein
LQLNYFKMIYKKILKKADKLFLKKTIGLSAFFFFIHFIFAQSPLQTIRGTIIDADSEQPLIGATITVVDSEPLLGTSTNEFGKFRIENLPVGYYNLRISLIGHETLTLSQLLLESGKELVLEIKLTEKSETLNEVLLIGKRVEPKPLSPVSINTLTQEEVLRFPGTFYDPSRLVMSFAGVANTDDQANNISIRGNSPNSLSWRLEGLEIVNPNHLSNAGTFSDRPTQNGGGVNILSAQLLGTSYFLSGAFPASYGNSLSGIMDMRLRPGNNEKYEFTAQAGVIGFDLAAEGPLYKKGGASFLINYRYSFIGLLTSLGVEVSDEDIRFQDLSFNINIPTKNAGRFTIFGMGGKSENTFIAQQDSANWEFQKDRFNIYFENEMGAFGITHTMPLGVRTLWSSAFAMSSRNTYRIADRLDDNFNPVEASYDNLIEGKNSFSTKINHKINVNNRVNTGIKLTEISHDFYSIDDTTQINYDGYGVSVLVEPYLNYQRDFFTNRLLLNLGLHYQYFSFNGSNAVEPRTSLKYLLNKNQSLSIAYGLQSQIQQGQLYFANSPTLNNENLGFTKAHHLVLGYENNFGRSTKLKTEIYYQSLFDVPISDDPNSSFSALNLLEGYSLEDLVNEGTGENYGVELSLQKTFSNDFFFLINGSYFDSKYTGGDGIKRDTRFNSEYIFNFTGGKEFRWNKKDKDKIFGINGRVAYYGGFRDTPIDAEASMLAGKTVYIESEAFSIKQADFFKLDLRLYWKNNKPKYSSTLSLDIQNATNQKNIAYSYFDAQQGEVIVKNQLGLIPVLSYRIEF